MKFPSQDYLKNKRGLVWKDSGSFNFTYQKFSPYKYRLC